MYQPFFPDPIFGWVFVVALAAPLAVAAWKDLRTIRVPKWLTVGCAAGGLLFNVVRCAWRGAAGLPGHIIEPPGLLAGVADGVAFSLAGLAVGFAVYFAMWVLGVCGGGDVKLVAATGAWLGPRFILGAILFSLPVVVVLCVVSYLAWLGGVSLLGTPPEAVRQKHVNSPRRRPRMMTFSFPQAVATLALLLLGFGPEIGLYTPPAPPPQPVAVAGP